MAMQIYGNYDRYRTDYTDNVKKVREAAQEAEKKSPGKLSEPQDEYISSEKSGEKSAGPYRMGDGKEQKAGKNREGKPAQICVGNTDQADQEIKNLREKKQQLEQQIRAAGGDENKIRKLKKKLAQTEQELKQKDNDAYRKQHTVFSKIR